MKTLPIALLVTTVLGSIGLAGCQTTEDDYYTDQPRRRVVAQTWDDQETVYVRRPQWRSYDNGYDRPAPVYRPAPQRWQQQQGWQQQQQRPQYRNQAPSRPAAPVAPAAPPRPQRPQADQGDQGQGQTPAQMIYNDTRTQNPNRSFGR